MKAKLGIAPIAWWNDDLAELSDDVSLEECLRQASEAGFTGMETGRRFPMDPAVLSPILERFGIQVCGGWFVVEAEQDPTKAPPAQMAKVDHQQLMRLIQAAGYEVVQ